MEILYVLIPLAIVLLALAVWVFFWAMGSGQYEDLEGPAHRILLDDDGPGQVAGEGRTPREGSGTGTGRPSGRADESER